MTTPIDWAEEVEAEEAALRQQSLPLEDDIPPLSPIAEETDFGDIDDEYPFSSGELSDKNLAKLKEIAAARPKNIPKTSAEEKEQESLTVPQESLLAKRREKSPARVPEDLTIDTARAKRTSPPQDADEAKLHLPLNSSPEALARNEAATLNLLDQQGKSLRDTVAMLQGREQNLTVMVQQQQLVIDRMAQQMQNATTLISGLQAEVFALKSELGRGMSDVEARFSEKLATTLDIHQTLPSMYEKLKVQVETMLHALPEPTKLKPVELTPKEARVMAQVQERVSHAAAISAKRQRKFKDGW